MSDLRQQIRDHYEAKSLSAGKVEAILARGRGGEKVVRFPVRARALLALAATVVLAVGLAMWWPHGPGRVSFAVLAPRVVEFFGKPPELPKLSQNPEELRAWLLAQGAPADFQIPAKLRGLESLGCKVVDVHGRQAWLTCFWREKKPDGTGGELVHLWVVKREDFKNGPGTATPQMHEESGWSFASWSEGDLIYTLATKAPMEKLRPFAAAKTGSSSYLSAKDFDDRDGFFSGHREPPVGGIHGDRRHWPYVVLNATGLFSSGEMRPPVSDLARGDFKQFRVVIKPNDVFAT